MLREVRELENVDDGNVMETPSLPRRSVRVSAASSIPGKTPVNPTPTQVKLPQRKDQPLSGLGQQHVITFAQDVTASPPRARASSLSKKSPPRSRPGGKHRGRESTAKQSYKSLQKLRQSNEILERVLAEQREKEQHLESNLRLLETTLRRTKDTQLRETVRTLNSSMFLLLVAALIWGNWMMFSPHFDAMIMACLVSAVLRDFQLSMNERLDVIQSKLTGLTSRHIAFMSFVVLSTSYVTLKVAGVGLVPVSLSLGFFLVTWMILRYSSSRTLTATLLTLVVTFGLCGPLFIVLRSCATEMELAATFTFHLMENRDHLLAFVDKLNKISFLRWTLEQTQLGRSYIVPEDLTEVIKYAASAFSANSALGLVTNASNLLWAFGTFMATLFSLLQLDLERLYRTHFARFSPLPSADNVELYKTVRTSTWQVFAGSACMGAMHGMMTYAALYVVGSPLRVIPAFISSCLAVAPFFGSWLPMVPFVMGFLIMDRELEAIFIASVQIVVIAVISPWLTCNFPTSAQFIGGLPIVAGLFAWGVCGILYGPLIVGLSIVTANIYLRYTHVLRPSPVGDFVVDEEEDEEFFMTESVFDGSGAYSSPRHHMFESSFLSVQ